MASLDVKSLFTNVALDFTIELILNNVFSQGTKDFSGLNKNQLKKLLSWTCKGTIFQFNGNIYEQIDGISMGSPITPLMADVCMNWILNEVLTFKPQPRVLFHYVDDLFCVFHSKDELGQFFVKINSVHVNIQFTKELEQHNQLPYLDVLVTKSVDKFETQIYI